MAKITMIGHASLLIEFKGARVLTDPCFSATNGFPRILNPIRLRPAAVAPEDLPPIDVIVCTHRHPDHFDIASLRRLQKSPVVFVPEPRMAEQLRKMGFHRTVVIRPWEEREAAGITVTATPAVEGGQGLPQVGYVLTGDGKSIYFGGDTMIFPEIDEVGRRFRIDVALPPISGTRVFGKQAVMAPEEAADAVVRMNARAVVPQHYDCLFGFPASLAYEAPGSPEQFAEAVRKRGKDILVKILDPGQTFEV